MPTYNDIKPTTPKQVKIWNKWNKMTNDWDFIEMRYWPADIAQAVLDQSFTYTSRFRLFLYLVGNGYNPDSVVDIINEMAQFKLTRYELDHLKNLVKDLKRNAAKWTYWDEEVCGVVTIKDSSPDDYVQVITKKEPKEKVDMSIHPWQIKKPMYSIYNRKTKKRENFYEEDLDTGTYLDEIDE